MKVRHLVGLFAIVGTIGLGTAVPVSAETNLVTNGDFETPVAPSPANIVSVSGSQLDGWTILPGGVMDVTNKNFADNGSTTFPVYSGNQALDLNSLDKASMTQDLTTVPGSTYHVFFALTGVPPVPLNECSARQRVEQVAHRVGGEHLERLHVLSGSQRRPPTTRPTSRTSSTSSPPRPRPRSSSRARHKVARDRSSTRCRSRSYRR